MAVLSADDREIARNGFIKRKSRVREPFKLKKPVAKATFDAIDDWVEANKASYNAALPVEAQADMTAAEKAEALVFVVKRRWEVGA